MKRIVTVEEPTDEMMKAGRMYQRFDIEVAAVTMWASNRWAEMLAASPDAGSYVAVPRELLERAIEWIGVSVAYRECGATREAIRALLKVSP